MDYRSGTMSAENMALLTKVSGLYRGFIETFPTAKNPLFPLSCYSKEQVAFILRLIQTENWNLPALVEETVQNPTFLAHLDFLDIHIEPNQFDQLLVHFKRYFDGLNPLHTSDWKKAQNAFNIYHALFLDDKRCVESLYKTCSSFWNTVTQNAKPVETLLASEYKVEGKPVLPFQQLLIASERGAQLLLEQTKLLPLIRSFVIKPVYFNPSTVESLLSKMPHLIELDLTHCSQDVIKAVCRTHPETIQSLNLSHTFLNWEAFFEVLSLPKHLKHLDLTSATFEIKEQPIPSLIHLHSLKMTIKNTSEIVYILSQTSNLKSLELCTDSMGFNKLYELEKIVSKIPDSLVSFTSDLKFNWRIKMPKSRH